LTAKDVIAAHARDELGIDLEELSSPLKAAVASGFAFLVGAGLPLLAGSFLHSYIKYFAFHCFCREKQQRQILLQTISYQL